MFYLTIFLLHNCLSPLISSSSALISFKHSEANRTRSTQECQKQHLSLRRLRKTHHNLLLIKHYSHFLCSKRRINPSSLRNKNEIIPCFCIKKNCLTFIPESTYFFPPQKTKKVAWSITASTEGIFRKTETHLFLRSWNPCL